MNERILFEQLLAMPELKLDKVANKSNRIIPHCHSKQDIKQDYKDKLRRFLATPHSSMAYFEEYKNEHKQAEFDVYTRKLENLVDALDNGEIKEHDELCQRIKGLKLPHNQFGCGG